MQADPLAALAAEGAQLSDVLATLEEEQWAHDSACAGWTVKDIVLHLAQTEEAVTASIAGGSFLPGGAGSASSIDDLMNQWVAAERDAAPAVVLERWRRAHHQALDALRSADPSAAVQWAASPLRPKTLATTRLSEHWIHALDITGPLGIDYPDTDRLWHICRLAHRTLPYAFGRAGKKLAPSLYLELDPPAGGKTWIFGEEDAAVRIAGAAGEFARVAARRVAPDETALVAEGEGASEVLQLIRTYA